MIGYIYISGEIGGDTNLIDVIRQVKAQPNATDFYVKIDSQGGYVNVGYDIYNYLKNLPQNVTTIAHRAYSIASVIFMAGSTRIVSENAENVLMIHLPWMEVAGNHETITAHLSGLKNEEDKLIKFYSEALQIDKETIQSLLSNETYLGAKEALEMGFATQIQAAPKAVAKLINNKKEEDESLMNKLNKKINQIFNKLSGIKAELILQDATGTEVVFPDLEATDIVEVGEKATVDGKPAEGDFIMPDGSTIRISAGVVSEIVPAPAEEDGPANEEVPQAAEGDTPTEDDQPAEDDKYTTLEQRVAELEKKIAELAGNAPAENSEVKNKMLEVVAMAAEKVNELQVKYEALAKQVGSDYQPNNKKETKPTVKASNIESLSGIERAKAILNS